MTELDRPDFLEDRRGFVPLQMQRADVLGIMAASLLVLSIGPYLGAFRVALDVLSVLGLGAVTVLVEISRRAAHAAKRESASLFLKESGLVTRIFLLMPLVAVAKGLNPIMPTIAGLVGVASGPVVLFMLWRWEHEIRRTRFIVALLAVVFFVVGSVATLRQFDGAHIIQDIGLRTVGAIAWCWWLFRACTAISGSVEKTGVRERPQERQRGARLELGQQRTAMARLADQRRRAEERERLTLEERAREEFRAQVGTLSRS